jgi:hypothetical protein
MAAAPSPSDLPDRGDHVIDIVDRPTQKPDDRKAACNLSMSAFRKLLSDFERQQWGRLLLGGNGVESEPVVAEAPSGPHKYRVKPIGAVIREPARILSR